ncbi:MAG: phosphatase PAP2-related protein [Myxococcaceae bacterium]
MTELGASPRLRLGGLRLTRGLAAQLASSFAFRACCYAVMVWLALWAEARPAPTLPDTLLAQVPYVPWVDRYNYLLWLAAYLPVALALLFIEPVRFCRYMVSSGLVALVRGACIAATGLGPVRGGDVNAGMDYAHRSQAFWNLLSPLGFFGGGAQVYLTKDLFFSGHTATTFLLLLYVWRFPRLRWAMLAGHLAVVASVFFSHLHYTIDVVGAYAIAFTLFFLREGDAKRLLWGAPPVGR